MSSLESLTWHLPDDGSGEMDRNEDVPVVFKHLFKSLSYGQLLLLLLISFRWATKPLRKSTYAYNLNFLQSGELKLVVDPKSF